MKIKMSQIKPIIEKIIKESDNTSTIVVLNEISSNFFKLRTSIRKLAKSKEKDLIEKRITEIWELCAIIHDKAK